MNRILSRSIALLLLSTAAASAQLSWGTSGAGGTGTWDTTTPNWFNGTSNVPWDGNAAVFNGSAGPVSIPSTVQSNQLIFNTPGYVISGGSLTSATNGTLTVTTNADATIDSYIHPMVVGSGSATFVKDGTG
ncbi:MAG: hypothetical protein ACAI37_17780, partial [Chthoniobacter sp.]